MKAACRQPQKWLACGEIEGSPVEGGVELCALCVLPAETIPISQRQERGWGGD